MGIKSYFRTLTYNLTHSLILPHPLLRDVPSLRVLSMHFLAAGKYFGRLWGKYGTSRRTRQCPFYATEQSFPLARDQPTYPHKPVC